MPLTDKSFATDRAGTGIPFIWAHGLGWSRAFDDDSRLFDFAGLADLLRYDARGHGQSPPDSEAKHYAWPALARDMLMVADKAGMEHYVAGGASMGCATALYAGLAAPERISGLVLALPPTAWQSRAAQADSYRHLADIIERHGYEALLRLPNPQPPFPAWLSAARPDLIAARWRSLSGRDRASAVAALRGAALTDLPDADALKRLTMPALILAWADDPDHPLETAERLAALLPRAELTIARTPADVPGWRERVGSFLGSLNR